MCKSKSIQRCFAKNHDFTTLFCKKTASNIWKIQRKYITFVAPKNNGRFVYRLGRKILNLKRGVRFPYRLQQRHRYRRCLFSFLRRNIAAGGR